MKNKFKDVGAFEYNRSGQVRRIIMFKEMRRKDKQLSIDENIKILEEESMGYFQLLALTDTRMEYR